ncbi:uncharacterized protein LOC123308319 isoform X2 [Coccinella septempunctata]|uniref:uncharacterized protein LOC123308319 isoform X2 n=1 Tax=Coccinella septempunctata TaxID=41139 RepID=UPI001D06B590|nr:uncharacterized protein LOC123308319 isoform X2 [Coccinella septempunctata]
MINALISFRTKPLVCAICQKVFSSISAKNRHLRQIHNEDIQKDKNQHVLCCLCPAENRDKFFSYRNYENHLKTIHDILVKESIFHFRSSKEFEAWRGKENREVDYAFIRTCKTTKGDTIAYYNCNRSNHRGYESVCEKRKRKIASSIHIQGVCPSRITVRISKDGSYSVTFVETHVGHDDDLRKKRLSKFQQNLLVKKLAAGIPKERIMKDARNTVQNEKLERLNIITRANLEYLARKHKINKIRHDYDMEAETSKGDSEDDGNNAIMDDSDESSGSNLKYKDEFNNFMQEKQNKTSINTDEKIRKIAGEQFIGFINQLSGDNLHKFLSEISTLKSRMIKDNEQISKKRHTACPHKHPNIGKMEATTCDY